MGLFHSPKITTNGLVASWDVANPKSYNPSHNLLPYSEDYTTSWSLSGVTATANTVGAPDGTLSGQTIQATGGSFDAAYYNVTVEPGERYTLSQYLKYKDQRYLTLQFNDLSADNQDTIQQIDILNGNLQTASPQGIGGVSAGIESVGGGWYRVHVTGDVHPSQNSMRIYSPWIGLYSGADYSGTGCYAWGAQFEKGEGPTAYTKTTGTAISPSTTWSDLISSYNGTTSGLVYSKDNNGNFLSRNDAANNTFTDASITLGSIPQTQQYTYEFSFKPTIDYDNVPGQNSYRRFIVSSAYNNAILLEETNQFRHRVPGVDETGNFDSKVHSLDEWAVAAFSYNQSASKNYYNGVLQQSSSIGAGTVSAGTISFLNDGPHGAFVGNIGHLRIYNRALTDAEIAQNFEAIRGRFSI